MNVDTGEFQALTERVAVVEQRLAAATRAAEIMRQAAIPDDVRAAAQRETERQMRRSILKVVPR